MAMAPEAASPLEDGLETCFGLGQDAGPDDPCSMADSCGGPDVDTAHLADLDRDERVRMLAVMTSRFCATYLRWMRTPPGDALTFSGVRVLDLLDTSGPSIMREIAARLGLTARNLTAIVDALEEAGLVRRVPHPHDRRAIVIELTPDGQREGAAAKVRAVDRAATAFDTLSAEDQQHYARLLTELSGVFCRRD